MFRPSAKRCCDIDRRPSPSPARKPRAFSMDDRRKRLRWAGSRRSALLVSAAVARTRGFDTAGGLANGSRERAPDDKLRVIRPFVFPATAGYGSPNPPYKALLLEHLFKQQLGPF